MYWRDRSPHVTNRVAGRRRVPGQAGAGGDSARAPDSLIGLRHGPRRHEPSPCALQDGFVSAGCQRGQEGARLAGYALPRRRCQVFASEDDVAVIKAAIVGLGWWGKTLV